MTAPLFLEDAYQAEAPATVTAITPEGGVVLDRSIFYATGGGQPGDSGWLDWGQGRLPIATTVKGDAGAIVLVPAEPTALPPVGTALTQRLDWPRRHRMMRVHSLLHLLSVVVPLPVTGGQISAEKGRLDFIMPQPPEDREMIARALNDLIERDLKIGADWIDQAELDARPELVKTLRVKPPRGAGRVRLIWIGEGDARVDLQPCGGTHVARTSEIGAVRLGKIEKKGAMNRRINVLLED